MRSLVALLAPVLVGAACTINVMPVERPAPAPQESAPPAQESGPAAETPSADDRPAPILRRPSRPVEDDPEVPPREPPVSRPPPPEPVLKPVPPARPTTPASAPPRRVPPASPARPSPPPMPPVNVPPEDPPLPPGPPAHRPRSTPPATPAHPEQPRHHPPADSLRVPPGHLPPPGQCRVWVEGVPPGRQARSRGCEGIAGTAPAGAWILHRPEGDRQTVHVRYVDRARAGVVLRILVFEIETGLVLREEAVASGDGPAPAAGPHDGRRGRP